MARAEAFFVSTLAAGGAALGLGLAMALGTVPDPTAGRLERPLWGVFAIVGILYLVVGAWLRMVRPKDPAAGDLVVGYVLYHTPRPALALAALVSLVFLGGWTGVTLGIEGPWTGFLFPASTSWTLLLALTVPALFLATLGALALAWSGGRGSSTRKASAARHLALAGALALLPWGLRAVFIG